VPAASPAEGTTAPARDQPTIYGACCTDRVRSAPEKTLVDRPQRFDRGGEVAIDGDIGDPLDVVTECLDLQVALAVVVGRQSPAVPREVIDLDEESQFRDPEVGVDQAAGGDLQRALPCERGKAASAEGALEA
jgi:hypothetical protein